MEYWPGERRADQVPYHAHVTVAGQVPDESHDRIRDTSVPLAL